MLLLRGKETQCHHELLLLPGQGDPLNEAKRFIRMLETNQGPREGKCALRILEFKPVYFGKPQNLKLKL